MNQWDFGPPQPPQSAYLLPVLPVRLPLSASTFISLAQFCRLSNRCQLLLLFRCTFFSDGCAQCVCLCLCVLFFVSHFVAVFVLPAGVDFILYYFYYFCNSIALIVVQIIIVVSSLSSRLLTISTCYILLLLLLLLLMAVLLMMIFLALPLFRFNSPSLSSGAGATVLLHPRRHAFIDKHTHKQADTL